MAIKILFEHGKLFGQDSPYGLNIIAINQDNKNYCDGIIALPYLSKLNDDEREHLFEMIQNVIEQVSRGTVSVEKGGQYVEPISRHIREKYQDYFN